MPYARACNILQIDPSTESTPEWIQLLPAGSIITGKKLLPTDPLLTGTVAVNWDDGTATVTLPGGGEVRVQSKEAYPVGQRVFIKNGKIQGEAPSLPGGVVDV